MFLHIAQRIYHLRRRIQVGDGKYNTNIFL